MKKEHGMINKSGTHRDPLPKLNNNIVYYTEGGSSHYNKVLRITLSVQIHFLHEYMTHEYSQHLCEEVETHSLIHTPSDSPYI